MRGDWLGYMGRSSKPIPMASSQAMVSPDLSMKARTIRGSTVQCVQSMCTLKISSFEVWNQARF